MATRIEAIIQDIMVTRLPNLGQRLNVLLGVALLLLVAGLDYFSTYEINCSLLYLLPVFQLTQALGLRGGIAMALACALASSGTDYLTGLHYSNPAYFLLNGFTAFLIFSCFAFMLKVLLGAYQQERHGSRFDQLTGIPNRRHFYEAAAREIARCRRNKTPLNVLAIDCDDFKQVNDTLGHLAGDQVLWTVGQTIQQNLRQTDVVARMGGDEFTVLLPEIGPEDARVVALKLRMQLVNAMRAKGWSVGFSFGLAVCAEFSNITLDQILHKADLAMYAAKKGEEGISEVNVC